MTATNPFPNRDKENPMVTRQATARKAIKMDPSRPLGPVMPALTQRQELALLCRVLCRAGYDDRLGGHITVRQPDDTLLVNPYGFTWDEVRAANLLRIDLDGKVLEGEYNVNSGVGLHLALHEARADVIWAVHNHPQWGTIWADLQRVPPAYDQSSAFVGDIAVVDEFAGLVADMDTARDVVGRMGGADIALLGNHGVLVLAPDVTQAALRALYLEWRCRNAWHVEAIGGGIPIRPEVHENLSRHMATRGLPGLWEAMARAEIRRDPEVLK
jgi:ribulose-5-phosphate 4-epimerase/fuculose-1-phosphate aldolase